MVAKATAAVAGEPGPGVAAASSAAQPNAALLLLRLEGDARAAKSVGELQVLIANETRKLTRARQIFVLTADASGQWQVSAASGVARIDRNVPLMQLVEAVVARLASDAGLDGRREFLLSSYAQAGDQTAALYPFGHALWFALAVKTGVPVAGVLMLRESAWPATIESLVTRLAVTFGQAWYWLATDNLLTPRFQIPRKAALLVAVAVLAVAAFPVSMTALAPLEIASRDAFVVAAPSDGVIETIAVEPNSMVAAGATLVQLADTTLRNKVAVAEREVQVADAKVKRALLLAVNDVRGRHELAIARSELNVKLAERDYARELAARTRMTAPRDGLAIYGDRRELVGRPVSVGERIMEIADPGNVEVRIDVPVGDAIILKPGARVKVFLDSAPLSPLEAVVEHADYQARQHEAGTLAFRVTAALNAGAQPPPRLGLRGTAEIFGDRVPFIYYALRRPISGVRQWIGL